MCFLGTFHRLLFKLTHKEVENPLLRHLQDLHMVATAPEKPKGNKLKFQNDKTPTKPYVSLLLAILFLYIN